MPPPSDDKAFYLKVLPKVFFVQQKKPDDHLPTSVLETLNSGKGFFSITRTAEEVTIVGEIDESNPLNLTDGDWKCIQIAGPMEFAVIGVICNFTIPLKAAGISVYAVSTWNTDYVLIPKEKIDEAVTALEEDGWIFIKD